MARGVSEPVALSQGRYGVLEALPRILTVLREQHGGAAGWLVANGWSDDQVASLRSRLRA